ncbi:hypothetical protein JHD48_03750 [Sulfurimonas sp. SAG-AH-194-I05]|nr:hypothetical protein [Sulfurimonas sp. SAG-AH-194-I05]MDF1874849.1 hypothetical protein [Sulfurimonas sp. SAG-AH-194-I05]
MGKFPIGAESTLGGVIAFSFIVAGVVETTEVPEPDILTTGELLVVAIGLDPETPLPDEDALEELADEELLPPPPPPQPTSSVITIKTLNILKSDLSIFKLQNKFHIS